MKFKEMYAEMLYSYKKLKLSFIYSGGVTLVISKNLDQNTANGGGKTSLLKILYFLIYGSDLKKAVKAEIPNRNGNGSYYGYIDIEDTGHQLRIERFSKRKDLHPLKVDKECLNFYIDGKLFMGAATGDDIDKIQEVIINRLRLSPRLFLSSVLTQQTSPKGNSVPFLIANDTQKKEILAEILDLTSYVRAHDATKKEIAAVEDRKKIKQNRVDSLLEQVTLLKDQIKEQEVLFANFDTEKSKEIEKEEKEIQAERNKVSFLKKTIKKHDPLNEVMDSISKNSERIKALEEELKDEVNLVKALTELSSSFDQKQKSLTETIKKYDDLNQSLNKNFEHVLNLDNYDLLTIEDFKDIVLSDINSISNKLTILEEEKVILTESLNKESELKNILNEKTKALSELEKKIDQTIYSINSLTKNINDLENSNSCPTCERDFDEKHRQEHIVPKIEESKKELQSLMDKKEKLETEKQTLMDNFIISLSHELEVIEELKEKNNKYGQLINYIKIIKTEYNNFYENKEKVKNELETNNNTKLKLENEIKVVSEELIPNQEKLNKISPFKEELESLKKEKISLESLMNKTKDIMSENKRVQDKINLIIENGKILVEKLKKTKESSNPHLEIIKNNNIKISSIEETMAKFNKSITEDDDELKYLKFWLLGFSPTGIRSFISDDLIEILNQKVASHLDDLFDGALSVLFEPESENNKGVSINKIETKYFLNGKEVSEESLSGGQIQRCILATDLALTEVAESRSGIKLNVKFLDEPFTGMDSAGQQQAFRLFNKLAKEKDGFFVISHDENFQSLCANTVHILYKNETSEIVSKADFDKYSLGEEQALNENIFDSKKETNFGEYLKEIARKNKKK